MEIASDIFSLSNPVLFGSSALVVTLVALGAVCFTMIRQRRLIEANIKAENPKSTPNTDTEKKENEIKTNMAGIWPTDLGDEYDDLKDLVKTIERDPVEFCEHIPGEVKRVKAKIAQKKLEEDMDEDQRRAEREMQHQQLENIFKLLKEQEDKFGIRSMDEMQDQMKIYVSK